MYWDGFLGLLLFSEWDFYRIHVAYCARSSRLSAHHFSVATIWTSKYWYSIFSARFFTFFPYICELKYVAPKAEPWRYATRQIIVSVFPNELIPILRCTIRSTLHAGSNLCSITMAWKFRIFPYICYSFS